MQRAVQYFRDLLQQIRRIPGALTIILGVAAALRIGHILALSPLPLFDKLIIDSRMYDKWAVLIAQGNWLGSQRAFYMDPLYPYLLAIQYTLFGHNLFLVRVVQAGLGVGTCYLLAVIGRRLGGPGVGLLAALLAALYQPLVFEGGEIEKTALGLFLITAALTCAIGKSTKSKFAAGALLALATLCRGNLLILGPLGALFFLLATAGEGVASTGHKGWLSARLLGQSGRDALAFLLGFFLLLSPVMVRNHYVSGEWVLTTSQIGANLYAGNNPLNWSGAYTPLPFVRQLPEFEESDYRAKAEELTGRDLSSQEVSSFWTHRAIDHVLEHPLFAAKVWMRKIVLFWGDVEIPDGWSLYFVKKYSPPLRWSFLTFGWIFPLALIGGVTSFRRSRESRLLTAFVGAYCLSLIIFFIFSRHRIYALPPLIVFAALGIQWLWERIQEQSWRKVGLGGVVLLAAALFSFFGARTFGYKPDIFISNYAHLAELYEKKGDFTTAEALLREALQIQPEAPEILCAWGSLRLTVGDPEGALNYLRRCAEVDGEYLNVWYLSGAAYERLQNYPEARRSYELQLKIIPGHQQAKDNLQRLLERHPF